MPSTAAPNPASSESNKPLAPPPVWTLPAEGVALLKQRPDLAPFWASLCGALSADPARLAPRPPKAWRAKRNAIQAGLLGLAAVYFVGVVAMASAQAAAKLIFRVRRVGPLDEGIKALARSAAAWRTRFDAFLENSGQPEALSEAFASRALSLQLDDALRIARHPNFDALARARKPLHWLRGSSPDSPPAHGAAPAQLTLAFVSVNSFSPRNLLDPRVAGGKHIDFFQGVALAHEQRELRQSVSEGLAASREKEKKQETAQKKKRESKPEPKSKQNSAPDSSSGLKGAEPGSSTSGRAAKIGPSGDELPAGSAGSDSNPTEFSSAPASPRKPRRL